MDNSSGGNTMTKLKEDAVGRTLRWMTENVHGAYTAKHPDGHPNVGHHCTNSGTCIIICCYINALGKVLLKGGPSKQGPAGYRRRDFERFQEFLQHCMNDFLIESDSMNLGQTPKGKFGGAEWLYEVYRCGFVHGYPANVAWGRNYESKKYWFKHRGKLALNIDELVRGFHRGVVEFRRLVDLDPDLRSRFMQYIVAD
jgi:hypothetical protein